jgi:hypothetical protein
LSVGRGAPDELIPASPEEWARIPGADNDELLLRPGYGHIGESALIFDGLFESGVALSVGKGSPVRELICVGTKEDHRVPLATLGTVDSRKLNPILIGIVVQPRCPLLENSRQLGQ